MGRAVARLKEKLGVQGLGYWKRHIAGVSAAQEAMLHKRAIACRALPHRHQGPGSRERPFLPPPPTRPPAAPRPAAPCLRQRRQHHGQVLHEHVGAADLGGGEAGCGGAGPSGRDPGALVLTWFPLLHRATRSGRLEAARSTDCHGVVSTTLVWSSRVVLRHASPALRMRQCGQGPPAV